MKTKTETSIWIMTLLMLLMMAEFSIDALAVTQERQTSDVLAKPMAHQTKVIDIVISGMDQNYIYASDGQSFPIPEKTIIIQDNQGRSKKKLARIVIMDGRIRRIIFR